MHEDRFHFNRGAIRPFGCILDGFRLIKSDYFFFVGVTFVGMLIAQLAPFDLLMGPAMCGIHICLLRTMNGQRVSFDMLFQGFNYFFPGLIAWFFIMGPVLMFMTIYLIAMFGGLFGLIAWLDQQQQQGQGDAVFGLSIILSYYGVAMLILIVIASMMQSIFLFVFPLIVDREMSGWEAVKTSVRASFANLGGVFMIALLELFFVFLGMSFCIGTVFTLPISFAMTAVAYRQVFPASDPFAGFGPDPEMPAPKLLTDDTRVQSTERTSSVQDQTPS